jgi:hypothetical protein
MKYPEISKTKYYRTSEQEAFYINFDMRSLRRRQEFDRPARGDLFTRDRRTPNPERQTPNAER